MTALTGQDIQSLVRGEVARLASPERRARLQSLLMAPVRRSVGWDYGAPGDRFDVWVVGQNATADISLVYADEGFGPIFPWGFVFLADDSLGMDSQWHSGLEDAAICAGLLEAPPGYEAPGPR